MSATSVACCDGSGWYTPAFSSTVLVNCPTCNADWAKGDLDWSDEDDVPGPAAAGAGAALAGEA